MVKKNTVILMKSIFTSVLIMQENGFHEIKNTLKIY